MFVLHPFVRFRASQKIHQVRHFWSLKEIKEKYLKTKVEETEIEIKIEPKKESVNLPESWSQPKVVIVGAGIAGLSAAHRLLEGGISDIKILEATDRPGGRIQSCWYVNDVEELGASVIQGVNLSNSIYTLALMEGLLQSPISKQGSPKGLFFTSRGQPVDSALARKACTTFRKIESMANALYVNDTTPEVSSTKEFMCSYIEQELKNFPELERPCALMVMNTCLSLLKEKTGTSLDNVSAKCFGGLYSPPGWNVKIPVGFAGILAPLTNAIPESSIQYCKPVKSILWDVCETDKPRACVKSIDEELFPADYVIITVPLGFLKDKAQSLFIPELPQKKIKAINTLGFGHLNHLFLRFPEPFWLKEEGDLMFAWDPYDYATCKSWIKGLSSLVVNENNKTVLRGTVSGEEAREMEALESDQIISDVYQHIQQFLGNTSIPRPISILRSKWSSDIYTQGAITYISTESGLEQIKDLGDTVPEECQSEVPILLFAGEHTCTKHYATAHGARDSGIREANRIIRYTNLLRGAPSKQNV